MAVIQTSRLRLNPFSPADFDRFVADMLTDPRVVEFYYSYRDLDNVELIRAKALKDFWDHFEESRANHDLEVWRYIQRGNTTTLSDGADCCIRNYRSSMGGLNCST